MDMIAVLSEAVRMSASDIHIQPGKPPMVRVRGKLIPLPGTSVLAPDQTRAVIYSILYEKQRKVFEETWELDCSFQIQDVSRFRVNVLIQKNGVAAVLRVIPSKIPSSREIGLSETIMKFSKLPRGLVLVTGPTGSGKSTTLACLLDTVNQTREEHIITLEDPIEFIYESKKCVITQREIGTHTQSFVAGLKHVLRQDPDIILIGEMRDLETISIAITLAETGHLVFATLHTTDAPQTIDRIIDVFPPYQQQQVRTQLSTSLSGVVCQQLLPTLDGQGRVAARELMMVTPAVSNLIREGKAFMIYQAIETGAKFGMITLDRDIASLVKRGVISSEVALSKANNPETLRKLIGAAYV